ncbi:putative transport protein [Streptomyces zagrosensis]|uniref:Putative transport protein n=1 Tax=Streptomyces zagrosensis TaxID=1042984 RepID=A0A7W9V019_9ACTN|nr:putative transport protein [Streptomyces zagrosensis]
MAGAVDEFLLGLGDGVNRVERKTYRAYQRLRNFACLCPPQRTKALVYLKANPAGVGLNDFLGDSVVSQDTPHRVARVP